MDIMLKNVRLAFPKLGEPEPFPGSPDKTEYFSANFILPENHPQFKQLDDALIALAKEKFGEKAWAAVLKGAKATGKVFFRDGDTKSDYDGFEGNWFVSARNRIRPTLLDGARNRITWDDGILFGGCYVNAKLGLFAYTKGNKGFGASISGIQFVRKGDAFGGGAPAQKDDFDDEISAEEDTSDSMMD